MLIEVRGNNIEQAMRLPDKRLRKSGWRGELRRHEHYVPPSQRRRQDQRRAVARHRKAEARRRDDDCRSGAS